MFWTTRTFPFSATFQTPNSWQAVDEKGKTKLVLLSRSHEGSTVTNHGLVFEQIEWHIYIPWKLHGTGIFNFLFESIYPVDLYGAQRQMDPVDIPVPWILWVMGWDENSQFGEGCSLDEGQPLKLTHHIFLRQFWVYILKYFNGWKYTEIGFGWSSLQLVETIISYKILDHQFVSISTWMFAFFLTQWSNRYVSCSNKNNVCKLLNCMLNWTTKKHPGRLNLIPTCKKGTQLNQGTLEELWVLEVVEVSSVFGTGQKCDLPELLGLVGDITGFTYRANGTFRNKAKGIV